MNDAVEALRLGAADYLIKPLEDLAVLEHSVRRALDRRACCWKTSATATSSKPPTASSKPACTCCRKTRTPVARCR
jgi:DNA-binding NtrC family response regulator